MKRGWGVAACFRKTWRLSPGLFPGFFPPDFCFTPWTPRGAVAAALPTAAMISLTDTQSKRSPWGPRPEPRTAVARARLGRPPAPPSGSMNEARRRGRRPAGLSWGRGTWRAAWRGRELDLPWLAWPGGRGKPSLSVRPAPGSRRSRRRGDGRFVPADGRERQLGARCAEPGAHSWGRLRASQTWGPLQVTGRLFGRWYFKCHLF